VVELAMERGPGATRRLRRDVERLVEALEQGGELGVELLSVVRWLGEDQDQPSLVLEFDPHEARVRRVLAANLDASVVRTELLGHHLEELEPGLVLHALSVRAGAPRVEIFSRVPARFGRAALRRPPGPPGSSLPFRPDRS